MDTQKQKRSAFSGKIGFVLSAAGASVGLGNIWRFPYLAAKYGGGYFSAGIDDTQANHQVLMPITELNSLDILHPHSSSRP